MFSFFNLPAMEQVDVNESTEVEELEQPDYPDYLLLPDLLNLNLEVFSDKFKKFALSRISFHDFSSKPGRSFYFFFAGLLSVLKDRADFYVNIETIPSNDSFDSVFSIYKGIRTNRIEDKLGSPKRLFLKIYIKGVSKEAALAQNFKFNTNLFLADTNQDHCSSIKIFYNKHNIAIKPYIKEELGKVVEVPLFNDFDLFRRFFKEKTGEGGRYLGDLWSFYANSEEFRLEKDFHLFILGLIANVNNLDYLNSNVERGSGRLDIMVKYTNDFNQLVKYVIELKRSKTSRDYLDALKVEAAFDQINNRRYGLATPSTLSADKIVVAAIDLNLRNKKITFRERDLLDLESDSNTQNR